MLIRTFSRRTKPSKTTMAGSENDKPDCSICCDKITSPYTTRCGHTFCERCLGTRLLDNVECPMCRQRSTQYAQLLPPSLTRQILAIERANTKTAENTSLKARTHSALYEDQRPEPGNPPSTAWVLSKRARASLVQQATADNDRNQSGNFTPSVQDSAMKELEAVFFSYRMANVILELRNFDAMSAEELQFFKTNDDQLTRNTEALNRLQRVEKSASTERCYWRMGVKVMS